MCSLMWVRFISAYCPLSLLPCPPHAVYDSGSVFPPHVLDISEEDLLKRFMEVWMIRPKDWCMQCFCADLYAPPLLMHIHACVMCGQRTCGDFCPFIVLRLYISISSQQCMLHASCNTTVMTVICSVHHSFYEPFPPHPACDYITMSSKFPEGDPLMR